MTMDQYTLKTAVVRLANRGSDVVICSPSMPSWKIASGRGALARGFAGRSRGNGLLVRPFLLCLFSQRSILLRRLARHVGIRRVAHQLSDGGAKLRLGAKMRWVRHLRFHSF
jgi:hypothetical protein